MIDMDLVEETIKELEEGVTSFDTCSKLASLYIIRQEYKNANLTAEQRVEGNVKKELYDILPGYEDYIEKKIQFQRGNLPIDPVIHSFNILVNEISEFLQILYNTSDTAQEQQSLIHMKENLHF